MAKRQPYDTLDAKQVSDMLGVEKSTLYKMVKEKKFPPGFPTTGSGGNIIVWLYKDVESFLHLQSRMVGAPPPEEEK